MKRQSTLPPSAEAESLEDELGVKATAVGAYEEAATLCGNIAMSFATEWERAIVAGLGATLWNKAQRLRVHFHEAAFAVVPDVPGTGNHAKALEFVDDCAKHMGNPLDNATRLVTAKKIAKVLDDYDAAARNRKKALRED